jgi:DNA invertase Pin-like site-specific DNA recombinase
MPSHNGKREIPADTRKRVGDLIQAGCSYEQIARALGVHRNSAWRIANQLGYPSEAKATPWNLVSRTAVGDLLRRDKYTTGQIAEAIGCGRGTVQRIAKELGIKLRRGRRSKKG